MAKNYFNGVQSLDELKRMYHKLAMEMHPDKGGTKKAFQELQNQYEKVFEKVKNYHTKKDGTYYYEESDETPDEFVKIINELLTLHSIKIEVIGSFLWVSGKTKQHKDKLKSLGLKYSSKKRNWYLAPKGYHRWGKKSYSMQSIRNMYGVKAEYQTEEQMTLA